MEVRIFLIENKVLLKTWSANLTAGVGACSLQEAIVFRKRLHLVGEDQFIRETIEAGSITAKKLCTAFGIRPPEFLNGAPDASHNTFFSVIC